MFDRRYVRSNSYDPNWVVENQMGPNALGLTEALTEIMPIEPGMKVLDLGCGKAMSSIFLAREFRVSVWATDLWIPATTRELGDEIPTALEPHWEWDFCCWHSPDWWRTHWTKTRKFVVDEVGMIEDGSALFSRFRFSYAALVSALIKSPNTTANWAASLGCSGMHT